MSSKGWRLTLFIAVLVSVSLLASCVTQTTEAPEPTEPPAEEPTTAPEPTEPPPEPTEVPPPEEVVLEVWYLSQSPEDIQNMENMSAVFEENHPGVTVEFSAYTFEDFNKTFKLALDSGTGPDLAYGQPGPAGHLQYSAAGHLMDLTDAMAEYGWDETQSYGAINYWKLDPADPAYGISYDTTLVGIFYNTEIFDELGLEPPETWEEMENVLETIKAAGYVPFSVGAVDGWTLDHYFQALVHVNVPIEIIQKIYRVEEGATYLDEGFIQAATTLTEWVDAGYFNEGFEGMGYADQNDLFTTGQAVMNLGGTWNNGTFIVQPDFTAGFFLLPQYNMDIEYHSILSPNNIWMVSMYSDNPELAVEYIDFFIGEEVALAKWALGDIPSYIFEAVPEPIAKLQEDVYNASLKTGIGYYFSDDPQIMTEEWAVMQALVAGDLTPEEAMAQMDELLQRLISEKE
jgi:raffinose/stachyose/melibiose transport system substrate-binding protein